MKVIAALLALAGVAAANSAYRFSDGYLDILGAEPVQNFDCAGRAYGYYADVSSDCRVFHVCLPVSDDLGEIVETAQFSFFCGNQTVFSQESLTCAHAEESFPCDQAETLFDISNAGFGVIPDDQK
ncbi:U-scoloptoxin(01)-Cw1a-like [Penaeus japonicus]|uniref:U-scoloptoxin(01)-Cw1a-like n=1 Tax=Penaeus japonicus TaxID=27405 RepID=UPI001C710D00|nr:U-scoloptoxin(01)-Cw1a-like [Penaeus japonicus]